MAETYTALISLDGGVATTTVSKSVQTIFNSATLTGSGIRTSAQTLIQNTYGVDTNREYIGYSITTSSSDPLGYITYPPDSSNIHLMRSPTTGLEYSAYVFVYSREKREYISQKQYDGEKWVEYVPKEVKGENKGATLSWGATSHLANIGGTDITVTMPSNPDTNTDTKTSSANSTSKLYLVGATSQSSSGQTTYSNSSVYATSGSLYATTMYEGSTSLANKYLGKTAKASSATSADSATKATQDASGNVITTTYATKSELSTARSEIEAAQAVTTVSATQPSNYKVGDIWFDTSE